MGIFRSNDPYYQARLNYSHAIHDLSSHHVYPKLSIFEQRFLKNVTKYTDKKVFPTITTGIQTTIHNMYSKHVGFMQGK